MTKSDMDQETAEEKLLCAVDDIADVQNEYGELTEEDVEFLRDAKSSIAAVYSHLDGPIAFDPEVFG